jgi:hypothetical protein
VRTFPRYELETRFAIHSDFWCFIGYDSLTSELVVFVLVVFFPLWFYTRQDPSSPVLCLQNTFFFLAFVGSLFQRGILSHLNLIFFWRYVCCSASEGVPMFGSLIPTSSKPVTHYFSSLPKLQNRVCRFL